MLRKSLVLVLFLIAAVPTLAQETGDSKAKKTEPKEQVERSKHTVVIDGKKIAYEAAAGTLVLRDEDGKATASMFYVAYTREGEDLGKRPITFCFNGGPGSSSVWLHLGAFGPRRVLLSEVGASLKPPARLVDNEWSLLDVTDLVFIDPVSTGYSRAAEAKDAKKFHGVQEDVHSVGDFIRLYMTRNNRWQSPKYLAGESYGTTRSAALANYLRSRHHMNLNGILLISTVLNFQTLAFDEGNDLPYALFLPSYTATAWYHKKLDKNLQADLKKTLAEVEQFALGEYTTALMKGQRLTAAERQSVTKKLAQFTGISETYIERAHLRIESQRFMRELLRAEGFTVGRFDSRFKGKDGNNDAERPDTDFSFDAVHGAFTTAFNHYVRSELGYRSDLPYEILTGRVHPWNFAQDATNRYLNVAPQLREAMTGNPYLRVFIANGRLDLATPYFATEYTVQHLGGDRALTDRITMTYYDAGHMMYIYLPALRKLKENIGKFMAN